MFLDKMNILYICEREYDIYTLDIFKIHVTRITGDRMESRVEAI